MEFIDVVLSVGRTVVELALFVMLPVMVVMLCIMRMLERLGMVDAVIRLAAPVLRPLGLTGLGALAMLQFSVVSFAAPIATLLAMEKRGSSDRRIASTMAMVLAMGQANVLFALSPAGLRIGPAWLISMAGGLVASAVTFYGSGRHLADGEAPALDGPEPRAADAGWIADINDAGREALRLSVGIIPMVSLALVTVTLIRDAGGFALLATVLGPALQVLHVNADMVVLTMTKYLAGGTAVLGLVLEMERHGGVSPSFVNASIGWLVNSVDLPGVAIFMAASPRLARVWKPAVIGACAGIALRTSLHCGFNL